MLTIRSLFDILLAKGIPKIAEKVNNISNNILIIDDDKWIQKLARNMLEKYGFKVLEASNASQGLEILIEQQPVVVLLDLNLPVVDGMSLLHLITNMTKTKNSKVLILSAMITKETMKAAHQMGAIGFIAKPFEEKLLVQKINECLDKDSIRQLKKTNSIKDEFFIKI